MPTLQIAQTILNMSSVHIILAVSSSSIRRKKNRPIFLPLAILLQLYRMTTHIPPLDTLEAVLDNLLTDLRALGLPLPLPLQLGILSLRTLWTV